MPTIAVELGDRSYPVLIGRDNLDRLDRLVVKETGTGRLFVFFDTQFYALHGAHLLASITLPKERITDFSLPPGEESKSPEMLTELYNFLLSERISRTDFILACGGGVTTDLVGYTASTVLRGINWGSVPTTLVGMVDAGIGGKTGINHHLGKNLIGAFWQPRFVWANIDHLTTLPPREIVSGLGEIIKYAALEGEPLMTKLRRYLSHGDLYALDTLAEIISISARCKARYVSRDERDMGPRMYLNFGHTFGHAIETSLGYEHLLHGETVILGIRAALELETLVNPRNRHSLAGFLDLLQLLMSLVPYHDLDADLIYESMWSDKKKDQSILRIIV
ncbi:MAG TPA: 3-dehydroquinate synthase family protein, partial [Candidatus Acidoferrum sp.]|nr:3-dehydroquinate synthase family protein [Candidatus Acidoferrum sp.]